MEKLKTTSAEEETALALANFLDKGYEGHIPTYAEEQLAYLSPLDALDIVPEAEQSDSSQK